MTPQLTAQQWAIQKAGARDKGNAYCQWALVARELLLKIAEAWEDEWAMVELIDRAGALAADAEKKP